MTRPVLIYLIAGEPSGDALGARLMARLKDGGDAHLEGVEFAGVEFAGVGGEAMEAEGLRSIVPVAELAVMGIAEVVPRIPRLLGHIRAVAADIAASRPDIVVTIDSPSFCARVWKRLGKHDFPLVHYVAPTVWAWRPGRAKKFAKYLDHLLALLPFEPPYFEKEGLACSFVGHPVLESGAGDGDGKAFRARHGIAADATLLCVLPGSRSGEIARLLPVFEAAVAILAGEIPGLAVALPTLARHEAALTRATTSWPVPVRVVTGERDKYGAMAASDAALAASGTVALELALAAVPHVVAYRVSPLTAFVVGLLVRVRFAHLVNLLLDRAAVPELIQRACTPERLAAELRRLLTDRAARDAQLRGLAEAVELLKPGGGAETPSARAAAIVRDLIHTRRVARANT